MKKVRGLFAEQNNHVPYLCVGQDGINQDVCNDHR